MAQPRVACCDVCHAARTNLVVWFGDDGYGYPYGHQIRCTDCPKPESIWIDERTPYQPLHHDKIFGISDWDVPFCWRFPACDALCYACYRLFDSSEGHGSEYLPEEMWSGRNDTSLLFCRDCYIERRRNHTDIQLQLAALKDDALRVEKESISSYFAEAPGGLLPTSSAKHQ